MTILKCSLFFYQFVYLPPFERLFIEVSGIHSLEEGLNNDTGTSHSFTWQFSTFQFLLYNCSYLLSDLTRVGFRG